MNAAMVVPHELTLTWAAACCAAEPGLDGLLLFDLPFTALSAVASALVQALAATNPALARPRVLRLGSNEDEDDLWSTLRPQTSGGYTMLAPAPGPLVRRAEDSALVVLVPDLARLSLAATRAATVLLGSPTAQLQRHGIAQSWHTATYWVAACSTSEVGKISQHLLDRFPVRIPATSLIPPVDPIKQIICALVSVPEEPRSAVPSPSPAWCSILRTGGSGPPVDDSAVERAVALHEAHHGLRRPLALLRLARATARLAGDSIVTSNHVERVALLTRVTVPTQAHTPKRALRPTNLQAAQPRNRRPKAAPQNENPAGPPSSTTAAAEPVLTAGSAEELSVITVSIDAPLSYPEDNADPKREAEPLKLPWQRAAGHPPDRGPVIGTMPARNLEDIAWFDTVRHAALYQPFRRRSVPGSHGERVLVAGVDLRAYRRSAQPERMLVLLLDHTCRHGWDWLAKLAPYLHSAYSSRATVCLVEVGGEGAPSLFRAERSMLRSLLDPRVETALSRKPGGSTPLAHGLELAGQALRHALQHGAATISEAEIVVVTDGLGNVPLDASRKDALTEPVGSAGITDAIDAAEAVRAFDSIRVAVVQPPRVPHPEILLQLVNAINSRRTIIAADRT